MHLYLNGKIKTIQVGNCEVGRRKRIEEKGGNYISQKVLVLFCFRII